MTANAESSGAVIVALDEAVRGFGAALSSLSREIGELRAAQVANRASIDALLQRIADAGGGVPGSESYGLHWVSPEGGYLVPRAPGELTPFAYDEFEERLGGAAIWTDKDFGGSDQYIVVPVYPSPWAVPEGYSSPGSVR